MKEIRGFRPEGPAEEEKATKAQAEISQTRATPEIRGFSRPVVAEDIERARRKVEREEKEDAEMIKKDLQYFLNRLYEFPPAVVKIIRRKLTDGSNTFTLEILPERLGQVLEDIEKLPEKTDKDRDTKTGLLELCRDFKQYLEDFLAGKMEHREIKGFKQEAA